MGGTRPLSRAQALEVGRRLAPRRDDVVHFRVDGTAVVLSPLVAAELDRMGTPVYRAQRDGDGVVRVEQVDLTEGLPSRRH